MSNEEQLPTMLLKQPAKFIFDKTEVGWKLTTDTPFSGTPRLSLSRILVDGENKIDYQEMAQRNLEAENRLGKCAGQHHLERMLCCQRDIPTEWQQFSLLAPGTVWQDNEKRNIVPCLIYFSGRWNMCYRGYHFIDSDRIVHESHAICL